jgi:hypothetical protein
MTINVPTFSILHTLGLPKFTQICIFVFKMYYLATLSGSATFQANAIHIQAENSKRAN